MKLTHAYNTPLKELISQMEVSGIKYNTDNENNLRTVEVVYAVVPEDTSEKKSGKFDNYEF